MRATLRSKRALWVLPLVMAAGIFPTVLRVLAQNGSSEPAITVTPAQLDFGETPVDTAAAPQTLTFSNTGQEPLTITNVLLSGIDFSQTTTCGGSLPPGASCEVQITFKPVTTGPRLGTISFDARPGGLRIVPLNGTGK